MNTTIRHSRCMNCSLACRMAVRLGPDGRALPEYVEETASAATGRLCFRGHYVSELINHPARLSSAWVRNGGVREAAPGKGLDLAAERLSEARRVGSVAVLVDGNFPCETIARAVSFVKDALGCDMVAVYVPPTDEGLLRGCRAAGITGADAGALADATTVLAVGDVLGTHPVLAAPILDAVARTRQGKLLAIDSMVGRTMRHAAKGRLIRPGGEAAAMSAIARAAGADPAPPAGRDVPMKALAERAGLDASAVEEIVSMLRQAQPAVVALSIPAGRASDAAACALAAAAIERACKTKTLVLCTYGNAAGALAAAAAAGALPLGAWLARLSQKPATVVLTIGTDLAGIAPEEVAQTVFSRAQTVISASSMPCVTAARADVVLPLAAPFETAGSAMTASGERLDLDALVAPPRGAMTVNQLIDGLAGRMPDVTWADAPVDVSRHHAPAEPLDNPDMGLAQETPAPGTLAMISRTTHFDLPQGSTSRQLEWVRLVEGESHVLISPQDAGTLGVRSGDVLRLSTPGGVSTLRASVDDAVPVGTLAAAPGLPDTRNLFPWRTRADGLVDIGPAAASIEVVRTTQ